MLLLLIVVLVLLLIWRYHHLLGPNVRRSHTSLHRWPWHAHARHSPGSLPLHLLELLGTSAVEVRRHAHIPHSLHLTALELALVLILVLVLALIWVLLLHHRIEVTLIGHVLARSTHSLLHERRWVLHVWVEGRSLVHLTEVHAGWTVHVGRWHSRLVWWEALLLPLLVSEGRRLLHVLPWHRRWHLAWHLRWHVRLLVWKVRRSHSRTCVHIDGPSSDFVVVICHKLLDNWHWFVLEAFRSHGNELLDFLQIIYSNVLIPNVLKDFSW